ncbi:MAG: hypothetical protein U5K38_14465 [Woeseiaceae bacterium]|nr:hypothetical protein [Woeseiaceae bacterium]
MTGVGVLAFIKGNIPELAALAMSALAIGVSVWQSFRNRRFQLKMERPELKMGLNIIINDRALDISLKNIGRGPGVHYLLGVFGKLWRLETRSSGLISSKRYFQALGIAS